MINLSEEEAKVIKNTLDKLCVRYAEMDIQGADYADMLVVRDTIVSLNILLPKELQNENLKRFKSDSKNEDTKDPE